MSFRTRLAAGPLAGHRSQYLPDFDHRSSASFRQRPVLGAAQRQCRRRPASDPLDGADVLYVDQHGRRVTNRDLAGNVWVADFIFTQCVAICPLMTAKMTLLQKVIRNPAARFVSFSVDPEHDTPTVLAKYHATWAADERRWVLLSTDKTVTDVARGMRVAIERSDDPNNRIIHSNLFFLVDQRNRVRGIYNSDDDEAMRCLARDADRLEGQPAGTPHSIAGASPGNWRSAMDGAKLYASYGCSVCHDQPKLAPPLAGLFGSTVTLSDGKQVVADEAYLRESIIQSDAKVVAGYTAAMPSYRDYLDEAKVNRLVMHIKSLRGDGMRQAATTPASYPPMTIDPVCKMKVRASNDEPHALHAGQMYYFCCDGCRDRFLKNPGSFLKPPAK